MFTPTRMAATRATAGHNWGIALSHDAVWLGHAQPAVMDGAGLLRLGCSVLAAGGVEGLGELLVERQARARGLATYLNWTGRTRLSPGRPAAMFAGRLGGPSPDCEPWSQHLR
jgi:hypothetical protein